MNDLLWLKGKFERRGFEGSFHPSYLPAGQSVNVDHIEKLRSQLSNVATYWRNIDIIDGALVSVHYIKLVAKSNRISALLSPKGKSINSTIRGARFDETKRKHIFTHLISKDTIDRSIDLLSEVIGIVERNYGAEINHSDIEALDESSKKNGFPFQEIMPKTTFLDIIHDCYYVESFSVDSIPVEIDGDSIITIYDTGIETGILLRQLGIEIDEGRVYNRTILRLSPNELGILKEKASYLIAMGNDDFSKLWLDDEYEEVEEKTDIMIPQPTTEPFVGVIDTHFNQSVYFSEWVDYNNMSDKAIEIKDEDKTHGTAVSGIIVDGPRGNPDLDDGCGRFRVRHFGVATKSGYSSFSFIRTIREIIKRNRDIKVWNISIGSKNEIGDSYISPEAAELDAIQSEFDVVFVIAGTNITEEWKKENRDSDMKIGAPADSINSLVVNAVDRKGQSASYTRVGPVLSFFTKPDISFFGGDGTKEKDKMVVCVDDLGSRFVSGTSYAAPWITRKMAYLIYILGFSREVAKALIIDSAAGWDMREDGSHKIGYGIVPRRIEDVVNGQEDEIRFFITETSEKYETFNYSLPVPVVNDKYPFYARATFVYFPKCDRNKGVDYTSTELEVSLGRMNGTSVSRIQNEKQKKNDRYRMYEKDVRDMYRKWDNVKFVSEEIMDKRVPRKAYESGMWGIMVRSYSRGEDREKLPFGMVVTLKEMYGKNRINEFVTLCQARGWIVNRINIDTMIDIHKDMEADIEFEE